MNTLNIIIQHRNIYENLTLIEQVFSYETLFFQKLPPVTIQAMHFDSHEQAPACCHHVK